MRGIVELWLSQLYKLTVLWPAWLLTPEGRETLFSRKTLWRLALAVVFALALGALMYGALPADLALIGAGDIVSYIDIIAIAWLAGAAKILRDGAKLAGEALRRVPGMVIAARREGRAAMRRRRPRRPPPPADDDGWPGERWTVAA
jgi:hypothetical protein